jgi:hypothetical protein
MDQGVGKQEHKALPSLGGADLKVVSGGRRRGGRADSGRRNELSSDGTGRSSPAALMRHSMALLGCSTLR